MRPWVLATISDASDAPGKVGDRLAGMLAVENFVLGVMVRGTADVAGKSSCI